MYIGAFREVVVVNPCPFYSPNGTPLSNRNPYFNNKLFFFFISIKEIKFHYQLFIHGTHHICGLQKTCLSYMFMFSFTLSSFVHGFLECHHVNQSIPTLQKNTVEHKHLFTTTENHWYTGSVLNVEAESALCMKYFYS